MSKYTIEQILNALNGHKTRATYEAVGTLLGCHAKNVAQRYLGNKRRPASWVVSKRDHMPTGYMAVNCHPELQSNPHVIEDPDELTSLLEIS